MHKKTQFKKTHRIRTLRFFDLRKRHRLDAPSVFLIYENLGPTGFAGFLMILPNDYVYVKRISDRVRSTCSYMYVYGTCREKRRRRGVDSIKVIDSYSPHFEENRPTTFVGFLDFKKTGTNRVPAFS